MARSNSSNSYAQGYNTVYLDWKFNNALTKDYVGNLGPGIRIPDEIWDGEIVSSGAVKMKGPQLIKVALQRAATWTTILL